jgi:hypothetical protein
MKDLEKSIGLVGCGRWGRLIFRDLISFVTSLERIHELVQSHP